MIRSISLSTLMSLLFHPSLNKQNYKLIGCHFVRYPDKNISMALIKGIRVIK